MTAEARTSMTVLHHCFVEALREAVEKMTGFYVCETGKDCGINLLIYRVP